MQRQTKQKQQLTQALQTFKSFFTAEDLHTKLENKKIGVATVYRFLKTLTENGELHSYQCNRRTLYSTHKKSHCHFTCERCGSMKHIDIKTIDFLKNQLQEQICHFQIDVSGVCQKCGGKQ